MTIDGMIEVLQAAKRGEVIQHRTIGEDDTKWRYTKFPIWAFHECEYRAQSKPRRWWVNVYPKMVCVQESRAAADRLASDDRLECVQVEEVLPE
jgi:hypothetical protein